MRAGIDKIERIYLITEVFTASSVGIDVKVGDRVFQWNSSGMMPVGFVFRKCEMSGGGILKYGPEVRIQPPYSRGEVRIPCPALSCKGQIDSTGYCFTREIIHNSYTACCEVSCETVIVHVSKVNPRQVYQ